VLSCVGCYNQRNRMVQHAACCSWNQC
jgi:hypothetical protein